MKTLQDLDIKDKTVLVRVDYNVPLERLANDTMLVTSDLKIRASLPTIQWLRTHGAAKIVLISHLGRPEGKDAALSLRPVADVLAELMAGVAVEFVDEVVGPEVAAAVAELPRGGVLLLENLRFEQGERTKDPAAATEFARELIDSTGTEAFVMDGFGVAHRATASTVRLAELLPSAAGLLVEKETTALARLLEQPARPFVVVIGGAKVADKAPLVEKFLPVADRILIGGKIAAEMSDAGTGIVSADSGTAGGAGTGASAGAGTDAGVADDAAASIKLPKSDHIYIAEDFDTNAAGEKLDIGPVATGKFIEALQGAGTVLWNGVLGKVEDMAFATGSEMVAKYLGEHPEITSVICGGDTAGFVDVLVKQDPELEFTLISTGGGAALEFLVKGELAGLAGLAGRTSD